RRSNHKNYREWRRSVARKADELVGAVDLNVVLRSLALGVVDFERAARLGLLLDSAALAVPLGERRLDLLGLVIGRLGIGKRGRRAERGCNGDQHPCHRNLLRISIRNDITITLLTRRTKSAIGSGVGHATSRSRDRSIFLRVLGSSQRLRRRMDFGVT